MCASTVTATMSHVDDEDNDTSFHDLQPEQKFYYSLNEANHIINTELDPENPLSFHQNAPELHNQLQNIEAAFLQLSQSRNNTNASRFIKEMTKIARETDFLNNFLHKLDQLQRKNNPYTIEYRNPYAKFVLNSTTAKAFEDIIHIIVASLHNVKNHVATPLPSIPPIYIYYYKKNDTLRPKKMIALSDLILWLYIAPLADIIFRKQGFRFTQYPITEPNSPHRHAPIFSFSNPPGIEVSFENENEEKIRRNTTQRNFDAFFKQTREGRSLPPDMKQMISLQQYRR